METIIKNSLGLINTYCPNIFRFITETEFTEFIKKAYLFTEENDGIERKANFLSSFLELSKEHSLNNSNQIRTEYGTLNYLLEEGVKRNLGRKFKDLVKSSILNFSDQAILDVMGELGACIALSDSYRLQNYEHRLQNGKYIDFVFTNQSSNIFVEILNVKINIDRYEKIGFISFMKKRVIDKYNDKVQNLPTIEKENIYILPVLHGLNQNVIQEQYQYFSKFDRIMKSDFNLNCFLPYSFCSYNNEPHTFKQICEI
jgi:hypothetical protein